MKTARSLSALVGLLIVVFILAGCRTYGGYGTEEATQQQIEKSASLFADELERARTEQGLLENAAATNPALGPVAADYAAVVTAHAEKVEAYRQMVEEAMASGSYRRLHALYGAMITDQHLIREQYARVVAALGEAPAIPARPTNIAPLFYHKLAHTQAQQPLQSRLAAAPADTTGSAQ